MRIIHFSDLHIGVENYGRMDPQTGLSSRLGDFLAAFDELVDYALESEVDLVLFAGDAYKSREPNQTHQREFAKRVARLASGGVQVFLLVGNHDLPHAIAKATAVEIFPTLSVANVTVGDKPGKYLIQTKRGAVQVVAIPWIRRSLLLSREGTKNLTFEQINDRVQEILTQRIYSEAEGLDKSLPALLTAHVSVGEAKLGSERTMMVGQDHVLLLSNIAHPAFDYIALGHIHRTQVLSQQPPVVYCGSLQRVDFSEEKDEKGFYVVDIDSSQEPGSRVTSYQFHPVKARPFQTIEVSIKDDDPDPTLTILKAIEVVPVADAIVRVQIQVPEALEGFIREGDIRKALDEAHFIAAITKEVQRSARGGRTRLGERSAEGMAPLEALELYLKTQTPPLSPRRIKELLQYGEKLIQEKQAEEV